MGKKLWAILVILLLCFITGCASHESAESSSSPPPKPSAPEQRVKWSAWAAYWDTQGVAQGIQNMGEHLESLQFFAAYFDAQNRLFIPEGTLQLRQELADAFEEPPKWTSYLTFVNDKQLEGGGSSLKDTQILYELLSEKETRKAHITEILALARDGGYDGIEIDYEAIRKDMALWEHFITFITELSAQAQQLDMPLRVVLEPGVPYDKLKFPQGPEYVVMCYNLHGPGSKPGPKADDPFLRELVKKTAGLPGKRVFALATGGYDWADGKASSLKEQAAIALAKQYDAEEIRDETSQAITFSYKLENVTHRVWYADATTLDHWMDLLRDEGNFGIALWRLE